MMAHYQRLGSDYSNTGSGAVKVKRRDARHSLLDSDTCSDCERRVLYAGDCLDTFQGTSYKIN
ncbi:hypothetical protein E2C01_011601 [Portunus trituberculatus]|uniref:Uncharacterized protein n=1 Tax=Portunus trituberculatus TaxID=210409 RepID=A0A5B7DBW0_PORTR|nr:hypothetical protein [Portunus trituberculatus]